MRVPLYDHTARRKTVSLTLNADLVTKSVTHGINISRVAEAALIAAFEAAEKATIQQEIRDAGRFTDEVVRKFGHPFPHSRAIMMPNDAEVDDPNHDAA